MASKKKPRERRAKNAARIAQQKSTVVALPGVDPGRKHHFDKRADQIIEAGAGDDDDLLSTIQVAAWFGVSKQWLEIGRHEGYGPPFVRVGPNRIRYRRGDVRRWLLTRVHRSTSEYTRAGA